METKKSFQGQLSAFAELSNAEILSKKNLKMIKGGEIDPYLPIRM